MLSSLRIQSTLLFRLMVGIVLAFLITLVASTTVLVTSVNRLGKTSISAQVEDEQLIIAQRIVEAQEKTLDDARFITNQIELIEAITNNDTESVQKTVDDSSLRFHHDAVIITDLDSMILSSTSTQDALLQQPDYLTIKQQVRAGEGIHTILVTTEGTYIVGIAPILSRDDQQTPLGTITIADQLDSERLGEINFGRSNMALVFFTHESGYFCQ